MYGLEALSFNVKDGYVGENGEWDLKAGLLPYPGHMLFTNTCAQQVGAPSSVVRNMHSHHPSCCADAVVRGHRSGLLTTADYNNLCQCETLDDIKLNLVSMHSPHNGTLRLSLASHTLALSPAGHHVGSRSNTVTEQGADHPSEASLA